ncbi:hypothetical protein OCGS_2358 [Oceaniovalibus guishaninsula JLT2003]|uniref:DUF1206 domain-containing protein n=1 Tax=Oceaniovalibus guishaninsula JLT2003 TaxID=1231392 RepID=K2GLQ0_9RHOB|nr:DUF1206 domain-containing protein [Oceaniovalibus guishaninsula]EKE43626.1 hypothetical protein OCGS_2358 [Oceaniovalibus guishaninsula JLT2003]
MPGTNETDFGWAVPVMRVGYAGRALVYLAVAGFALWAIWHGQQAEGTSSAFQKLEDSWWGATVLIAVFLGLLAYAVWRLIDAIWDLEDYGSDGEGIVARLGMVVTGLIHLAIGIGALAVLFTSAGSGDQSAIASATATVMGWPAGRWIVGIGGLLTIGAGGYYLKKAWGRDYREHLIGNHFTRNWDPALRGGVAAQGLVVGIIGALLVYAAFTADPSEAGGMGQAFDWVSSQAYGRILVGLLCVGLLSFALFLAVNAAYRIVPKAQGDDLETLATRFKDAV